MTAKITQSPNAGWCVAASDQCVVCGLCLPHCPTYMLKRNEADSPRGRISLIKALASAQLAPNRALVAHLDGCLQCRRCEAVCPAKVPFGRLMDTARGLLFETRGRSPGRVPLLLKLLAPSRALRRFVLMKLRLYHASGLRRLLLTFGFLKLFALKTTDSMLPSIPKGALTSSDDAALAPADRQVALFTGCVAEILDRDTLLAAKKLLEAAGFAVVVSERQTCCGALHQHAGDAGRARKFIERNAAAFSEALPNAASSGASRTVVSCASGCGAQLQEHETALGVRHFDVHTFLQKHTDTLTFRPLDRTVALHTPCTMDSCLHGAEPVSQLLARVPELHVVALENRGCCGAAGAYMLTHRHDAGALLDGVLDAVERAGTKTLLSSNIGCIAHLRQGISRRGTDIEVMHPTVLLARQVR